MFSKTIYRIMSVKDSLIKRKRSMNYIYVTTICNYCFNI